MENPSQAERDPLAHLLEWGLMALVVLAPLPFGAVGAFGRAGMELWALALGLLWMVRSRIQPTRLPARLARAAIIGLVLLAILQILPLGHGVVSILSPRSAQIHDLTAAPPDAAAAEERLLGLDPASLDRPVTLSVDPGATASALRTGAALGMLFFVATSVAAVRGARRIVLALLISASFQGLYGIMVLASGYNRIWYVEKIHYLDAATGTYVNKNHFACFLAMSLACGVALVIRNYKKRHGPDTGHFLVRLFSSDNSRNLLLGLLLVIGLAGLLLSLSRSGIALGLAALVITILAAGKVKSLRTSVVLAVVVVLLAAVPILQLGTDQLADRYARSAEHWSLEGGRPDVWEDTLRMAAAYPLFGSGYGTFAVAYPLHRSPQVRLFYKHAHNDLLQAMAEGGSVGLILSVMLLIPILVKITGGIRGAKGTLGVGLAAGLGAFLLHSLIDFNLHIPANAAVAIIIAGTIEGLPWKSES